MGYQREQVIAVLDHSKSTGQVLRWAAQEATLRKVPLHLIQTFVVPTLPQAARLGDISMLLTAPQICQTSHDTSAALLSSFRRIAAALYPELSVTAEVACGSVATVSAARSCDALLTVVASRGAPSFPHRMFGSVPARIVGRASGPMVIIPPPRALDGRLEPCVVVALDGLPDCGSGLGFAFQAAADSHRVLLAVHTWDAAATEGLFRSPLTMSARLTIDREKYRRMQEELAAWKVHFPEVALQTLVLHGRPATALLHLCRSRYRSTEPALVVVVSRGHRGLLQPRSRTVIGSLIAGAPCPVAVIHCD